MYIKKTTDNKLHITRQVEITNYKSPLKKAERVCNCYIAWWHSNKKDCSENESVEEVAFDALIESMDGGD